MTVGQFALEPGAQVGDFFLVHEQVRIAGHPELVATQDVHAGEQFSDELVEDGGEENETVFAAGQFLGQADDPGQDPGGLDDGGVGAAAEGVLAFEFDGEVEALVEHPGERMGGVQADGGQHGDHFPHEIAVDPFPLGFVPAGPAQEADALVRPGRAGPPG